MQNLTPIRLSYSFSLQILPGFTVLTVTAEVVTGSVLVATSMRTDVSRSVATFILVTDPILVELEL